MLRRLLPIAVFLCYVGIFGIGKAAATALPMSRCSTTSGLVVAVDFSHWGGPIVRGCGSTPTNGAQLINQGGFSTVLVRGEPFVCRLGYSGFTGGTQYPAGANCGYTPPSNAYWSYWNADPGQHNWTFSTKGAYDSHPVAGAVQAWEFGDGSQPSFSPDSVRAQNSPPPPSSSPTSKSSSAPASSSASNPAGGTRSAVVPPASPGPASGHPTKASSAGRPTPTGSAAERAHSTGASLGMVIVGSTGAASSPSIVDAKADAASHPKGSGSALPLLAGAAIVLVLAGFAGYTAWHRRGG